MQQQSMTNTLFYGDNLDVLRQHIDAESVDLVYLDPPFNSNADYNVLFSNRQGMQSTAQIKAFTDTWRWDESSAWAFQQTVEAGGDISRTMQAFRTILGDGNMLAYLSMMAPRLLELARVLKPTGSLYLHCDPTASHYLKIMLDAIFGPERFRNEIIWRRSGSHNSPKRFGPLHDVLLFYSKSESYFFQKLHRPYTKVHVDGYFKKQDHKGRYWTNALTGAGTRKGASGEPWRGYDPTAAGRHWAIPGRITQELGLQGLSTQQKLDALDAAGFVDHPSEESEAMPTYRQYLDDSPGTSLQDIWSYQPGTRGVLHGTDEGIDEDVRWLVAQGDTERLGYPTQKPLGLLKRIIRSSCPPDGLVLDPFCGCGTAVVAAQELERRWVGIDITHLATHLIKTRLQDAFAGKAKFNVTGEPTTIEEAVELGRTDPYQFQYWALGLVGARSSEQKKGADKGVDGQIYFHETPSGPTKQVIFSVKAGKVQVQHLRDLRGVVDREKAQIGVLISLQAPTGPMRKEAASAGFYESMWGNFPKLQLLTVGELLDGKIVQMPPIQHTNATFKRAKYAHPNFEQGTLH